MRNINNLLEKINAKLSAQYGAKHKQPITSQEIEKVYGRNSLLSVNVDAKTKKGSAKGYLTGILYLAPSDLSGFNVCPAASAGCKAACLFSAGRGKFYSVNRARLVKTFALIADIKRFEIAIHRSITALVKTAGKQGMVPVVRLNGTSDLAIEQLFPSLFKDFAAVQFYDYTKLAYRFSSARKLPPNYHLTFSLSETNVKTAESVLQAGFNVAAVFSGKALPAQHMGRPVIVGDSTDLRFLDGNKGQIVGLTAKGLAKKDNSGFVIQQ